MAERQQDIEHRIEQTREEMGETVDALSYKADVPGRMKGWVGDKKDAVVGKVSGAKDAVTGAVGGAASTVADKTPDGGQIKHGAGRAKSMAESNPIGLAIGGAAIGFIAGLFVPSTRVEDERLGEMSDQLKDSAKETAQEAVEHGKEVAKAAAQSAGETVQQEGQSHAQELTDSLQEKARDVTSSDEEGPEIVFEPDVELDPQSQKQQP
jgi:gas vesicle protein